MFFGDSTVVGRGVPQDKTVSAQLEGILRARGENVEAINAGVEGYSTDQVLLAMERLLPLYHPDVVLYGVCTNDFEGLLLSEDNRQAKPRFILDADHSLREVPPHVKERIVGFGSGPRAWLQHLALYRTLQPRMLRLRARLRRWDELLPPAEALDGQFYSNPATLDMIDWALFTALLERMDLLVSRTDARLLIYLHPAIEEVWEPYIDLAVRQTGIDPHTYDRHAVERRVAGCALIAGATFCPFIDHFASQPRRGPFHLLPRDPHCNSIGYGIQAEALAQAISHKHRGTS